MIIFFAQCKLFLIKKCYLNDKNKSLNNVRNEVNKKTIGMPRAMSYYNNYPFYYGFFTSLGYEIVLSDKTTTNIINKGSKLLVSDTCFPIKVYVGHVVNLLEKGCETIFVPSLQSVGFKINNCSKVRGLPEIIRNVINKDFKMIEPTLDKTENVGIKDFCTQIANQLDIFDVQTITNAIGKAWQHYDKFISLMQKSYDWDTALDNTINGEISEYIVKTKNYDVSVVIMAHGYNLYDERISLNLLNKLEQMNVKAYTGLNVSENDAKTAITELGEIRYWANELELTGTAGHFLLNKKVDGVIALSAFGCGPDSLMVDEIAYHCKNFNVPLIHLTIDEHTGEAGFVTRLEAFVDMLVRKKRLIKHQKAFIIHNPSKDTINNYKNIKKLKINNSNTKETDAQ